MYFFLIKGNILRIRATDYKVLLVLDLDLLLEPEQQVNEILINEGKMTIYVSTSGSVLQINLQKIADLACGNYRSCENCLADPLCSWDVNTESCLQRKKGVFTKNEREERCQGISELGENSYLQSVFEREELNVTVDEQTGSLVLQCSKALVLKNRKLGLSQSLLAKYITWYRNDIRLLGTEEDYCRISNHGELVLFNLYPDHSSQILCKYKNYTILQVNLDVLKKGKESLVNIEKFEDLFVQWMSEIQSYTNRLDEFKYFSNCTIN